MATRTTAKDRGRARANTIGRRLAHEIRTARISLGLSQRQAAQRAGVDRSAWGRFERSERDMLLGDLIVMAAVVGLDLAIKAFVSDLRHPRDVAHLRLLADLRYLMGPGWEWRYEVPIGPAPSRRAWDAVARHRETGLEVRIEAETNLEDIQLAVRLVVGKKADSGNPRTLLVVRASKGNRLAVRAGGEVLRSTFPVPGRIALARLRAGEDPGGDALLLIDWQAATRA